jgi:hypothetical protein
MTAIWWPRFESKFRVKADGCWLWQANIWGGGYGRFFLDGDQQAHRVAYEELVGPIPEGLDLDHLCRNRACVNPEHLEPVTRRENLMRGETIVADQARRTHCPRGHEYTVENTYVQAYRGRRLRSCKECRRAVNRAWAARQREMAA